MKRLIREQLRIMRRQVELMQALTEPTGASDMPTRALVVAEQGLVEKAGSPAVEEGSHLLEAGSVTTLPLTDGQRAIWVTCQLSDHGSAAFNLATLLSLKGDLDVEALHEALRQLRSRHEALRTTFDPDGELQVIHADTGIDLPLLDVSDDPEPVRTERVNAFLDGDISTPYDLATGPLFRATLIRLAADEHVLVVSMHHLIGDGWSFDVMRRELGVLYEAAVRGTPAVLEEPTQYREYVAWRAEQTPTSRAYWMHLYDRPPVRLDLPTDGPRPEVQSYAYGYVRTSIGEDALRSLKAQAAAQGVTLFTVLLTGWEILLHRLSGQHDFVHAVFTNGQPGMGVRSLLGFCTNPLPLRAIVDPTESVSDALKRSRRAIMDALDHRYFSVEQLATELRLKRDPSRPALVSVGVTMESALSGIEFGGLEAAGWDHGRRLYGPFDLELYLMESDDQLTVDLQYSVDVFERDTVEGWQRRYVRLLSTIAADANVRVADLEPDDEPPRAIRAGQRVEDAGDPTPTISSDDLVRLASWNDTTHPYPDDAVVHELFDAQAAATPDRIALIADGATVTYAELLDRSNRLAHHLVAKGVTRADAVGVAAHRSPESIVSMLAAMKAGASYLPLDPALPADRLAGMIADARVGLILTGPGVDALPATGAELIDIRTFDGGAFPSTSPLVRSKPDDPMYVIFTSGSTGRPKGVQGTHRGAINRFSWQWETYPFSEDEVCCQKTSLSFVDHVWETWGPLLKGHALVLIPDDVVRDGARFVAALAAHGIERLVTVPALFAALLDAYPDLGERLPRLRTCTLSGERLTTELAKAFRAAVPNAVLLNFYGMTEGSGDATWYDDSWGTGSDSIPIGRPIYNMRVHLLDDELRRVPIGAVGEIHLAGVGLATSYVGRPDLTAERFLADPFDHDPSARMYRTGDLARWLADGTLEYVGRVDHQLKLRGIRVEPGEIETVARSLDGVGEAIVAAPRIGQESQLVAYVTLASEHGTTADRIRAELARKLPEYMVPAQVIVLDQLPRNGHGKVDRSALPVPSGERPVGDIAYAPPRTAVEHQLAEIWQDILGIGQIGVHDDFFDLGGDSLMALRCITRANRAGIALAPISLFRYPTIAELADTAADATPSSEPASKLVTGPTPLTPAQLRFLEERQTPEAHHWNISTLARADRLSPTALRTAVEAVMRHHDALRLRVWQEAGGWRQETAGLPREIPFTSHDISTLSADQQLAEVERVCTELQASFDLGSGSLLRVAHFDRGPSNDDRLFIAIHHFAVDGMTWSVFMEDLEHAYDQAVEGRPVTLPPKTTSIKSWASGLERMAAMPEVTDLSAEWLRLPWHEVARLPTDQESDAAMNTNASVSTVELELGPEETSALLGGRMRPEHVILTAVARALSRWTASRTVLIDVLSHGRDAASDDVNLSRTVGFTLSYNPLVVSHPTWEERPETVEALAGQVERGPQGFTFELLRFKAPDPDLRQRLSELPRADVLFNYAGAFLTFDDGSSWTWAAEPIGPAESPRGLRQYPLAVRALLVPNLRLVFIYSRELHRRETIEAKAAEVVATIRQLLMGSAVAA
jgi:amino acid adenylation domain-containing protein